jgi:hypothetical protein
MDDSAINIVLLGRAAQVGRPPIRLCHDHLFLAGGRDSVGVAAAVPVLSSAKLVTVPYRPAPKGFIGSFAADNGRFAGIEMACRRAVHMRAGRPVRQVACCA